MREYAGLYLAALPCKMIQLDHSFKLCKRVRDEDGGKQYGAFFTAMNECGQPLLCLPTGSKAFDDVRPAFEVLVNNWEKLGYVYEEVRNAAASYCCCRGRCGRGL